MSQISQSWSMLVGLLLLIEMRLYERETQAPSLDD
jgi:hypothetical protein